MQDFKWFGTRNGINFYLVGATLLADTKSHGWVIFQSQKLGNDWASMFIMHDTMESWLDICAATEKLYRDKTVLTSPNPAIGPPMA